MSKITIRFPQQATALETAIATFMAEEFNHHRPARPDINRNVLRKDASCIDIVWTTVTVIATVEGTLQFSERLARLQRVKTLLAAIKQTGQAVYLKINNKAAVDLSQSSVDETMDLLSEQQLETLVDQYISELEDK